MRNGRWKSCHSTVGCAESWRNSFPLIYSRASLSPPALLYVDPTTVNAIFENSWFFSSSGWNITWKMADVRRNCSSPSQDRVKCSLIANRWRCLSTTGSEPPGFRPVREFRRLFTVVLPYSKHISLGLQSPARFVNRKEFEDAANEFVLTIGQGVSFIGNGDDGANR